MPNPQSLPQIPSQILMRNTTLYAERIAQLQKQIAGQGYAAVVVPRSDEHQGEWVAESSERLRWLTGFGGSAGRAVVTVQAAALFLDGRYASEAKSSLASPALEVRHMQDEPLAAWLAEQSAREKSTADRPNGAGQKSAQKKPQKNPQKKPTNGTSQETALLGYDPWLTTRIQAQTLSRLAIPHGLTAVAMEHNPIDALWQDKPAPPSGTIALHPTELAGESSPDKRTRIAKELTQQGLEWAILTLPDSIAWLFNARGQDLAHVPVALSFAALHKSGAATWFVDTNRLEAPLKESLTESKPQVALSSPSDFPAFLASLSGQAISLDPETAPEACFVLAAKAGAKVVEAPDPCLLPKACKNEIELSGTRLAHLHDGLALVRFLAWLESALENPTKQSTPLTEATVAEQLDKLRTTNPAHRGASFETISGSGPHAAMMHYRVSPETDRPLARGEPYLVDSGGQYSSTINGQPCVGTTDVTRTLCYGNPPEGFSRAFTLVLKGHIALATARWKQGLTGDRLDPLARQFLWREGLDYDHGTGHGVGVYLAVHEGPQRISPAVNKVALRAGMIVSNEPGFYRDGHWGIRIENLVAVRSAGAGILEFENLTLAPIQRSLIEKSLLTESELAWLNDYHAQIRDQVGALLTDSESQVKAWLEQATQPL